MFDGVSLTNWHRTVFALSNRLTPADIDAMPYMDFKIFTMLFKNWVEESTKKGSN